LALAAGLGLGAMWVRQTFPHLLGWALDIHVPYARIAVVCASTWRSVGWRRCCRRGHAAALQPAETLRSD
jgi:hypothetical protein